MNFYDYEAEDAGFEILDFPCNQFGNQAPGTTEEIASFCCSRSKFLSYFLIFFVKNVHIMLFHFTKKRSYFFVVKQRFSK